MTKITFLCLIICSVVIPFSEQSKEIANGKPATASSLYLYNGQRIWTPDLAVDGSTNDNLFCNSCLHTSPARDIRQAFFRINLSGTFNIERVEIYYRAAYERFECPSIRVTDDVRTNQRFAGYSIHVSDNSDWTTGVKCYQDSSSPYPSLQQNNPCTGRGSYITLYNNNRAPGENTVVFELCEVMVFGCESGSYGVNCSSSCPNCLNGYCDPQTGVCVEGCSDGWLGSDCETPCPNGFFGRNCTLRCGNCFNGESCLNTNGTCLNGCTMGFRGTFCNESCIAGTYGFNCEEFCGNCSNGSPCDTVTGFCVSGCAAGWRGQLCKTECTRGTYGFNCNESCGQCIGARECDIVTGHCPAGCGPGWLGILCKTACPAGTYGLQCNKTCGNCSGNDACDITNGYCMKGCNAGWQSPLCKEACIAGTYGFNCEEFCGNCSNGSPCDTVTGFCVSGCAAGWRGQLCKTECTRGTYGFNCNESCGQCIGARECECDIVTGHCPAGCGPGWLGILCKTACPAGTYGLQCNKTCGNCSGNDACDITNGYCMKGCNAGWQSPLCKEDCIESGRYGHSCSHLCSGNCNDGEICNYIDGSCSLGCVEGFSGVTCSKRIRVGDNSIVITVVVSILMSLGVIAGVIVFLLRRKVIKGREEKLFKVLSMKRKQRKTTVRKSVNKGDKRENEYANVKISTKKEGKMDITLTRSASGKSPNLPHSSIEEEDEIYSNESLSTEIQVTDLKNVVGQKIELKLFSKEYKELPKGAVHAHDIGKNPENKLKNRFLTTFLYDHSLVRISKIDNNPNSDYINANYIDGTDTPSAYIATQGPKRVTLFDFWRMIWENNSGKIVMLANLLEMGSVKCKQYWPEQMKTPLKFNYLLVYLRKEQVHGSFTFRSLEIKNTNTKEFRTINHFHFTSWPDHGTPDPIQLIIFHHLVTKSKTSLNGPTTVHCSAGIGRTGVYIALDEMLKTGRRTGKIDVFGFVNKMRQNRMSMIQTEAQYVFVHNALIEAFLLDGSFIPRDDFANIMQEMRNEKSQESQSRVAKEFQNLESIRSALDEDSKKIALSEDNMSKNRDTTIIPHKTYRVLLTSQATGRSDYINAVVIPTLHSNFGMIVTQFPLRDTVQDFWCLVYDRESSVIVILDEEKDVSLFPSNNTSETYGSIIVESDTELEAGRGTTHRSLSIRRVDEDEESKSKVQVIEATNWKDGDILPSHELIMDMVTKTYQCCTGNRNGSVVVVCKNGAKKSGLFSAVYLILEAILKTGDVNILPIVRQIQLRRPEFIADIEQYDYCYDFADVYLEEFSDYANT